MPHNRNNSVGLELTVPVEKRDQQSDRGDNSVSMIPFPEIVTNIPDIEQQPDQEQVNIEVPTITNTNVKPEFTPLIKRLAKFFIFLVVVGVLFYGRFNVPDNPVPCIIDKILDGLKVPNDFILAPGNESYRRGFQILGSLLIDLTFLTTFIYWIVKGTSLRLPLTLGVFYVVRAINQLFWFSPYPEGFYWDDPGFPSLVVPYGRGSDFFFSGHSGFVVICAREMFAYKLKKTSAIMWAVLAYTVMCLLIYRIHYSIDIFVGVFFADWCFIRAEQVCNKLVDPLCYKILVKLKHRFFKRKNPEANGGAQAQAQTQSQNQVQAKNHK